MQIHNIFFRVDGERGVPNPRDRPKRRRRVTKLWEEEGGGKEGMRKNKEKDFFLKGGLERSGREEREEKPARGRIQKVRVVCDVF